MNNANETLKAAILSLGGLMSEKVNIAGHYSEPQRHYHTLQHINECLVLLKQFESLADNLDEVTVALIMHDFVYDPRAKNNEKLSADYVQRLMIDSGIKRQSCINVYQHIMATATHAYVDSSDTCLVMDIDMLILAADEPRLVEYESQIRQEYSHVPGFIYKYKRKAVLRGFLKQKVIYYVPEIREVYEHKARSNIDNLCRNII